VKSAWRIWAYALGQKEGKSDKEADVIALIRTLIMAQLLITNCFIIAGNIRHWNDHDPFNTSFIAVPSKNTLS